MQTCAAWDVIKWKHFLRYWPFVRRIHRSPVNSSHKAQWRGDLMFSLICVWINGWVNNREAGDLRRYRAHDDVFVMEWECLFVFRQIMLSYLSGYMLFLYFWDSKKRFSFRRWHNVFVVITKELDWYKSSVYCWSKLDMYYGRYISTHRWSDEGHIWCVHCTLETREITAGIGLRK